MGGKLRALILVSGFIVLAGALQACTDPCDLTDYTVTKTADTNDGICSASDCSLREAVITANACPGHQTIHLPPAGYVLTIPGTGEDAAATGDLDITDDLSILGTAAPSIDAGGIDRVFEVFSPAVVDMELLIIVNGEAQIGAGVLNHSELTMRSSSIHHNTAVVPPGGSGSSSGGGIFNETGTLRLEGTQVFDNQADDGAGIHNFATATLSMHGGLIGHNIAASSGGGLWVNAASSAELDGVIVNLNEASVSGGGIYNAGSASLRDVQVVENVSDAIPGGGGIFNADVSDPALGEASMTIADSLIAQNDGGGILNRGMLTITGSTVRDNFSSGDLHPGIESDDQMSIMLSSIMSNEVSGVVTSYGSTTSIEQTTISGNVGGNGAGMIAGGSVTVEKSTIADNQAASVGGGIEVQGGNLSLVNSTISGNSASDAGGGVIIATSAHDPGIVGALSILDSTVALNEPDGLYTAYGGISVERSIVSDNLGSDCGSSGVVSSGYNLDSDGSCGFGLPTDLSGVSPSIGPLASNGGPTETHALLAGSPAIDAAGASCSITDQRGVARPQGFACDIGAYESEEGAAEPVPTPTLVSPEEPSPEPATMNFNVDDETILAGECTTLRWEIKNAITAFLDGKEVKLLDAQHICPLQTTTYHMKAIADSGDLDALVTVEVIELPEPPNAPAQPYIDPLCDSKIYRVTLRWIDMADNEDGFRVYRDGGLVATLGPNTESYTETLPDFGSYTYGAEAFNAGGSSSQARAIDTCDP